MSNEQTKDGQHILQNTNHEKAISTHLERITNEFRQGFDLIQKYPKSITVFGSSRAKPESDDYKHAYEISKRIVTELKYSVFTGGGPGIMEAASRGARDAGGNSVGFRIKLLRERIENAYTTETLNFSYFFARKAMLTFTAETYIYFPGGFGTFDELFSVLTLIQTGKIPRVPIILFGSKFWSSLKDYFHANMLGENCKLDRQDLELFEITDDPDRVLEIVGKAPVSEWWRNLN